MDSVRVKFHFRVQDLGKWYSQYITKILSNKFRVIVDEKDPDFIFHDAHLVDVIKYQGVRIAIAGENVRTDFNISDYGIGFDPLTYLDRYIRFPLYLFYSGALKAAEDRPKTLAKSDGRALSDRKFCNFLVSNGAASEFRTLFFKQLSEYKTVDSGGRYLNNIGWTVKDKATWQKEYKFSLCFENSSSPGYLTEKLIQAYASNTIPVYWGDPLAAGSLLDGKSGINPDAVIWVDRLKPELALRQIKELDMDVNLYIEKLSQPLFVEADHSLRFEESLRGFLYSLFDQDREEAYRRGFGQVRLRVENRNIARSSYLKSILKFLKNRIRI